MIRDVRFKNMMKAIRPDRLCYRIVSIIGFAVCAFVLFLFVKKTRLGVIDYTMLGELLGFLVLAIVLWLASRGWRQSENN